LDWKREGVNSYLTIDGERKGLSFKGGGGKKIPIKKRSVKNAEIERPFPKLLIQKCSREARKDKYQDAQTLLGRSLDPMGEGCLQKGKFLFFRKHLHGIYEKDHQGGGGGNEVDPAGFKKGGKLGWKGETLGGGGGGKTMRTKCKNERTGKKFNGGKVYGHSWSRGRSTCGRKVEKVRKDVRKIRIHFATDRHRQRG